MVVSEHAHDERVAAVAAEVTGSAHGVAHLFDSVVPLAVGCVIVCEQHGVPGQGAVPVSNVIHTDQFWRTRDWKTVEDNTNVG